MTETMDAADDEVYVRLTGDERRMVVEVLESWVQSLEWLTRNGRPAAANEVPVVRRVLAKVSE